MMDTALSTKPSLGCLHFRSCDAIPAQYGQEKGKFVQWDEERRKLYVLVVRDEDDHTFCTAWVGRGEMSRRMWKGGYEMSCKHPVCPELEWSCVSFARRARWWLNKIKKEDYATTIQDIPLCDTLLCRRRFEFKCITNWSWSFPSLKGTVKAEASAQPPLSIYQAFL